MDSSALQGQLYLVATPIGNLEDITLRAVRILGEADIVAAEDTRHTRKLLSHLGLSKELWSYHQHSTTRVTEKIVEALQQGKNVALVSDAGMPCVSDPGQELVAAVRREGLSITVIPGPSAALSAYAVAGFAGDRFAFEGFLPTKQSERKQRLVALQGEERTLIVYEAPHRLARTLQDLHGVLGNREATLVRELTKMHEEILQSHLGDLVELCATREPRGEYVIVIAGADVLSPPTENPDSAIETYRLLLGEGYSRGDALREAARRSGLSRDSLYRLLSEASEHAKSPS